MPIFARRIHYYPGGGVPHFHPSRSRYQRLPCQGCGCGSITTWSATPLRTSLLSLVVMPITYMSWGSPLVTVPMGWILGASFFWIQVPSSVEIHHYACR